MTGFGIKDLDGEIQTDGRICNGRWRGLERKGYLGSCVGIDRRHNKEGLRYRRGNLK